MNRLNRLTRAVVGLALLLVLLPGQETRGQESQGQTAPVADLKSIGNFELDRDGDA